MSDSPDMKMSEALRKGRTDISEPGFWVQGTSAKTIDGRKVSVRDPEAVCFCAGAAVERYNQHALAYLDKVMGGEVTRFNDAVGRTHAEILSAIDEAVALAESDGN